MRRVHLDDGGWVDLRDKEEITVGGRRGIQAIAGSLADVLAKLPDDPAEAAKVNLAALGMSETELDAMLRLQQASVVAFLAGWSLPDPLPTLHTVDDMPAAVFDRIAAATAADAALVAQDSPVLDMSVGDGAPDPKEPSGD